jgi:hypothetical protein
MNGLRRVERTQSNGSDWLSGKLNLVNLQNKQPLPVITGRGFLAFGEKNWPAGQQFLPTRIISVIPAFRY